MNENWNTLKLIQWTKDWFEKAGIPNPRLDAELLLAHVMKCQRVDLYTRFEWTISEKDRTHFKELIQRREKREPLQYILGETEFYGLKFKVTPDVLIPRPETELLVEEALKSSPLNILEIGTGSGCIAIALAKNLPQSKIIATDISQEALEIARQNVKLHGLEDRVELIAADIAPWKRFLAEERQFDLIVSNPPYVPVSIKSNLQPEIQNHEPDVALFGGPDGLDFFRTILQDAIHFLKPGGHILFEIGENHNKAVSQLLEKAGFQKITVRIDYQEIDRIIQGKKNG